MNKCEYLGKWGDVDKWSPLPKNPPTQNGDFWGYFFFSKILPLKKGIFSVILIYC